MTTAKPNTVTPWGSGRQPAAPGHRTQDAFQVLRLLHQPGDLLFLPDFGTSPPAGGRTWPGESYIVRPWLPGPGAQLHNPRFRPKGRYPCSCSRCAAGEVWAAHAVKSPGADPLLSGAPVPSAAKAAGRALQIGGRVMLVESDPVRGGPYRRSGSWGAPGSQPAAGPADGPGSGRPAAWGGLISRAPPYLGSPHQQPRPSRPSSAGEALDRLGRSHYTNR